jgi:hypothetical protein
MHTHTHTHTHTHRELIAIVRMHAHAGAPTHRHNTVSASHAPAHAHFRAIFEDFAIFCHGLSPHVLHAPELDGVCGRRQYCTVGAEDHLVLVVAGLLRGRSRVQTSAPAGFLEASAILHALTAVSLLAICYRDVLLRRPLSFTRVCRPHWCCCPFLAARAHTNYHVQNLCKTLLSVH